MARIALLLSLSALLAAVFPTGMFFGMALAILAATMGFLGYRRVQSSPWSRLAGALSMTVALFALLLVSGRFALTWWAVDRLTAMLS